MIHCYPYCNLYFISLYIKESDERAGDYKGIKNDDHECLKLIPYSVWHWESNLQDTYFADFKRSHPYFQAA